MESAQRVTRGIEYPAENCDSYEEGMRHRVSGVFDVIVVAQGSRDFEGCTCLKARWSWASDCMLS